MNKKYTDIAQKYVNKSSSLRILGEIMHMSWISFLQKRVGKVEMAESQNDGTGMWNCNLK